MIRDKLIFNLTKIKINNYKLSITNITNIKYKFKI